MKENKEIADSSLSIPADTFLLTTGYKNFVLFHSMKQRILDGKEINADSLVASNPGFYNAYVLAGDYLYKKKKYKEALQYYQAALTKVIATKKEEDHIREQISKLNKKTAP